MLVVHLHEYMNLHNKEKITFRQATGRIEELNFCINYRMQERIKETKFLVLLPNYRCFQMLVVNLFRHFACERVKGKGVEL